MRQKSQLRRAVLKNLNALLEKCLPALLPLCSRRVPRRVSQRNLAQNKAHDIAKSPIYDQNMPEIHAFRFGKSHADAAGCGPIALYNALLLRGTPLGFSEVIRQTERERGVVRGGVWGANPAGIARALCLFGVGHRRFQKPEQLANAMENGDTAIVMIWNDKDDLRRGAHFFAVQKTDAGYQAYNRFSGQKAPFTRALFSEILANGRYLLGYALSPRPASRFSWPDAAEAPRRICRKGFGVQRTGCRSVCRRFRDWGLTFFRLSCIMILSVLIFLQ